MVLGFCRAALLVLVVQRVQEPLLDVWYAGDIPGTVFLSSGASGIRQQERVFKSPAYWCKPCFARCQRVLFSLVCNLSGLTFDPEKRTKMQLRLLCCCSDDKTRKNS